MRGHAHLKKLDYLENYYKKSVEMFSIIPFASSRQWFELILGILSSSCRTAENGVAGPRPLFW